MSSYPVKWGFLNGLDKAIGKTIAEAELVAMEHGSIWSRAWVVRFTDGTRAFFVGDRGSGVMNPDISAMEKTTLFLPEEYAEVMANRKRIAARKAREAKARKLEEYKLLKRDLGL